MLMLYLYKVEVFDRGPNYSYSTDCVVIGDTQEDRGRLIRCQFDDHNGGVVKRSVLLGARALTLSEVKLLSATAGTRNHVWLMTRVSLAPDKHPLRPLPRLYSECDMLERELLDRSPSGYDSARLMKDQYMQGVWFSKADSICSKLRLAA